MALACLFGHKWNGCKCTRCGKTRDESHNWNKCSGICTICGKFMGVQHTWGGCKCVICGERRYQDAQHSWNGYRCSVCNTMMNENEIENLLTDQKQLAELAKTYTYTETFVGNDESAERLYANNTQADKICGIAVKKLTDQKLLADVAKNAKNDKARIAAAGKLTDQEALFEIARRNDEGEKYAVFVNVRIAAIKKLTDQSLLTNVAQNGINYDVRIAAAEKLADQDVAQKTYIDIAKNAEGLNIRIKAYEYFNRESQEQNHEIKHKIINDMRDSEERKRYEELKKYPASKICKPGEHRYDDTVLNKCKCTICGFQFHVFYYPFYDGSCGICGGKRKESSDSTGRTYSVVYPDGTTETYESYGYQYVD